MVERASVQRRWILIAAVAAVLIIVGIAWVAVASGTGPTSTAPTDSASAEPSPEPSTDASTDPSATAGVPGTPAATPPQAVATAAPPASDAPIAPEAEPVAPDEVATRGAVEVELLEVEHVDGQAIAPGEIAGPAIRLTVEVRNSTDEPIEAGLIAVNAYFGAARSPANPLMQPGGTPFGGSIAPGESARGIYLFESGDAELTDTLVGVDVVPGQSTFTFRGDLR